jgi:hypothetical protein
LRFGPSTRYCPISPPTASLRRAPLLGFVAPPALMGEGSPRTTGCPAVASRFPGKSTSGSQPLATVSLAGFLSLSATCSSPHRPAIFRRVALLGFAPSGVSSCDEAPGGSSPPACPLDVAPTDCAFPVAYGEVRGRADRSLEYPGQSAFHRLQGLTPRHNRSAPPLRLGMNDRPAPPGCSASSWFDLGR